MERSVLEFAAAGDVSAGGCYECAEPDTADQDVSTGLWQFAWSSRRGRNRLALFAVFGDIALRVAVSVAAANFATLAQVSGVRSRILGTWLDFFDYSSLRVAGFCFHFDCCLVAVVILVWFVGVDFRRVDTDIVD